MYLVNWHLKDTQKVKKLYVRTSVLNGHLSRQTIHWSPRFLQNASNHDGHMVTLTIELMDHTPLKLTDGI